MNGERYPELFQFFAGYFHEDWPVDAATPDEVIDTFIEGHARNERAHLADLIDAFTAEVPPVTRECALQGTRLLLRSRSGCAIGAQLAAACQNPAPGSDLKPRAPTDTPRPRRQARPVHWWFRGASLLSSASASSDLHIMPGRSESDLAFGQVLWPDATLEHVAVDYDAVVLRIRESTGIERTIRCEGHIALRLEGFWDEVIIERAELVSEHAAIERATDSISRRLGTNWLDSGNEERNSRHWLALIVYLADGCPMEIVAARLCIG